MAKRKYTKRSPYWDQFKKDKKVESAASIVSDPRVLPDSFGDPYYDFESKGGRSTTDHEASSPRRQNRAAFGQPKRRLKNIEEGILPHCMSEAGLTIRDPALLCQKAYFNIGVFRNTIDAMAELADSELYFIKGTGSVKSRKFFEAWFNKVGIKLIKKQYFREYYRSGNVLFYRLDGTITSKFLELTSEFQMNPTAKIPVRYALLNPTTILAKNVSDFTTPEYEKILSKYEISVLKNPKTDHDKAVFNALPDDVKKMLRKNQPVGVDRGVMIPIDPKRLHTVFYKKQDYEPFAMPFGFPALEDLNTKLEFKKVDRAICRTIENVVLLITMGAEPDKGGVNPVAMQRMQELFKNESVGRVLVSDYTTKGDFLIPDLKKVIYKEKYDILNRDIQEALQNILISDEKFSNIEIKVKVFVERLGEAREAFLNEFLQPEIDRIGKELGFRSVPTVAFKEIDIKDSEDLMRVATRLVELGIMTPEQAMDLFNLGRFPKAEEMEEAQKKYREDREEGFYNPLVGGTPMGPEADEEREIRNKPPAGAAPAQQKANPKAAGRPKKAAQRSSKAKFERQDVQKVVYQTSTLFDFIAEAVAKKSGLEKPNDEQTSIIEQLGETIITAKEPKEWEKTAEACVKDFNEIEALTVLPEIDQLAMELDMDFYSAALLYHSKNIDEE